MNAAARLASLDARSRLTALDAAVRAAGLPAPLGAVDLGAWRANATELVHRAGGRPVRVATESVRSRALLRDVLARPGFTGLLAASLPEAMWLAGADDEPVSQDVVVGYPSVDLAALTRLAARPDLAARVTLTIDDLAHLDLLEAAGERAAGAPDVAPLRVCLDLDPSRRPPGGLTRIGLTRIGLTRIGRTHIGRTRIGRMRLGARRPPVRSAEQAAQLAEAVVRRTGLRLVGLMAGEPRAAAAAVAAVRQVAERAGRPLEFVNAGGAGGLELRSAESMTDESVTELTAGPGLLAPALLDAGRAFRPAPAGFFALPVVRRPAPGVATVLGGGWVASGPPGLDRLPVPVWPAGLRLRGAEGAGEVQTPLAGPGAASLEVGDLVWFRHAKAGELCEHVRELLVVDEPLGGGMPVVIGLAPTYRGEDHTLL